MGLIKSHVDARTVKLHQYLLINKVCLIVFIALAWSVHIVSVTLAKCTSFCLLFRKQWKVMKRNWLSFPGGKPKNGLYTFYVVCLKGKIVSMGLTRLGTLHKLSLFWARQRGRWYCTVYCLFCTCTKMYSITEIKARVTFL